MSFDKQSMDTCESLGITDPLNEKCPDCGGELWYSHDDLTVLTCEDGCGWSRLDDPEE
jgi:hypothetical protein